MYLNVYKYKMVATELIFRITLFMRASAGDVVSRNLLVKHVCFYLYSNFYKIAYLLKKKVQLKRKLVVNCL